MARITKTIYRCDVCGETVENAKALYKQRIISGPKSFRDLSYSYTPVQGIALDMCEGCEVSFINLLGDFLMSDKANQLLRPQPKRPKKVKADGEAKTAVT